MIALAYISALIFPCTQREKDGHDFQGYLLCAAIIFYRFYIFGASNTSLLQSAHHVVHISFNADWFLITNEGAKLHGIQSRWPKQGFQSSPVGTGVTFRCHPLSFATMICLRLDAYNHVCNNRVQHWWRLWLIWISIRNDVSSTWVQCFRGYRNFFGKYLCANIRQYFMWFAEFTFQGCILLLLALVRETH